MPVRWAIWKPTPKIFGVTCIKCSQASIGLLSLIEPPWFHFQFLIRTSYWISIGTTWKSTLKLVNMQSMKVICQKQAKMYKLQNWCRDWCREIAMDFLPFWSHEYKMGALQIYILPVYDEQLKYIAGLIIYQGFYSQTKGQHITVKQLTYPNKWQSFQQNGNPRSGSHVHTSCCRV